MQDFLEVNKWLVQFVQDWGYIAVFLGSMVEGESVIFIAGFFAHQGILSLPTMILVSFLGTLFSDQSCYYIGRHYGNHVIDRFPSLRVRADRAFRLLKRYDILFILSFRFIYGIRTISPLIIGSSGIGIKKFTILNFFAAIIWSVGSCLAAYYFADFIIDKMDLIPKIVLGVVFCGGAIVYFIMKWRKRNRMNF